MCAHLYFKYMFKTLYVNIYLKLHCNISSWGCSSFIWKSVSIENSILFLRPLLAHSLLYSSSRWRAEASKEPQFYWLWVKREGGVYTPAYTLLSGKNTVKSCAMSWALSQEHNALNKQIKLSWKPLFCHLQKKSWCKRLGTSLSVLLCDGLKAKLFSSIT